MATAAVTISEARIAFNELMNSSSSFASFDHSFSSVSENSLDKYQNNSKKSSPKSKQEDLFNMTVNHPKEEERESERRQPSQRRKRYSLQENHDPQPMTSASTRTTDYPKRARLSEVPTRPPSASLAATHNQLSVIEPNQDQNLPSSTSKSRNKSTTKKSLDSQFYSPHQQQPSQEIRLDQETMLGYGKNRSSIHTIDNEDLFRSQKAVSSPLVEVAQSSSHPTESPEQQPVLETIQQDHEDHEDDHLVEQRDDFEASDGPREKEESMVPDYMKRRQTLHQKRVEQGKRLASLMKTREKRAPPRTKSQKANIIFPVKQILDSLKNVMPGLIVNTTAAVALAAVLEYLNSKGTKIYLI